MAIKTCNLQPPVIVDGITCKLERQLRSRKKTHSTQSQEDRWKAIYRILFPLEIIPSPCKSSGFRASRVPGFDSKLNFIDFEPLHEEATESPGAIQLSDYEEYSRRELPRIFRGALEEAVNQETEPIAERLRNQLINMIQECQERVFSTYRSRMTPSRSSPLPRSDTCGETQNSIRVPTTQDNNIDGAIHPDMENLFSFFQPPPYQYDIMGLMDTYGSQDQNTTFQNERSDSGYASNFSGHQNQSSTATDNANIPMSEFHDQVKAHMSLGGIDPSKISAFSNQIEHGSAPTTTITNIMDNDLPTVPDRDLSKSWQ